MDSIKGRIWLQFTLASVLLFLFHQTIVYKNFNLVSQLLWFSLFLRGCTGLWWIMVAICHCENGGLMVLPICVNDCLKVFTKVARWIFVSNGGFTRNLQF